nr:serine hydrolase [Synergistales bacterium]
NIESITKVMVTLPITFKLLEEGMISLEEKVMDYLPEFATSEEKKKVTLRDMLNFTSGIPLADPEGCEEAALEGDLDKAWTLHYRQDLDTDPETRVYYSDVSCRILGKVLERVMKKDLGTASKEWFFDPLGMESTMFTPSDKKRCACTGISDRGRQLRGELTQDLEHYLGEVLGSDGIFSNAQDMLIFSEMLLNGGVYHGKKIMGSITTEKMIGEISNAHLYEKPCSYLHYILSGPKVWFWEYACSPYSFFGDLVSERAIGKMGGAGTFLLIDPEYDLVIVYLTNYGQPERTLAGDEAWNKFQKEINMMGLCNLVIGDLPC